MSPEKFQIYLEDLAQEAQVYINHGLPIVVGKMAVDHFKENFQKEGFDGVPWDDVKRRSDPRVKGARATRKILTGDSGDLGESINYETGTAEVTITSDKEYASAHNEGTTNAGRNRNVTIPKRQFIGESDDLNKKIEQEIERKFKNDIFK